MRWLAIIAFGLFAFLMLYGIIMHERDHALPAMIVGFMGVFGLGVGVFA